MKVFNAFFLFVIGTTCSMFFSHAMEEEERMRKYTIGRHFDRQEASNPAFVTVIDSTTDLEELCYAFQTLVHALGFPNAPIFTFHGVKFDDDIIHMFKGCTLREVIFVDITEFFKVFPYGFEPTKGVNYDKQRTEHFVIADMWEIPHLKGFDVILRFSDSTCLTYNNKDLPGFQTFLPDEYRNSEIVYQTQTVPHNYVIGHEYVDMLFESTLEYMAANHIVPKNDDLWPVLVNYQTGSGTMPKFDNTFEVIRRNFMERKDVRDYHNFIAELKADEFYNNKWSSEVVRYLTMSIFANAEETYIRPVSGYVEKNFLKETVYPDVCRFGPFGTHYSVEEE